jgi:branched-chain amino acid transport system substrate-binding protein
MPRGPHRRTILRAMTVAATSLALPRLLMGCSGPGGATGSLAGGGAGTARDPVKVALLLPTTADPQTAAIAKAMKQAAELAVFDLNQPGLQLIVKDDRGSEEGARTAAKEAIAAGAEIILGPLFSRSAAAVAPLARQANVPVISFSNDRTVAGSGVYLLSFLPDQEVSRIITFAAAQGRSRVAALLPKDALGDQLDQSLRAAATRSGSTLVAVERYALNTTAIQEPAKKISEVIKAATSTGAPVDALFLPGTQDTLQMVAPFIPYLGIDTQAVRLLGTSGWDTPVTTRDKSFAGGWFAAPNPRGWQIFSEKFAKSYRTPPPRLASLAHDAMLLAGALASGSRGSRYSAANLTRAEGFTGIDGRFRLLQSGLVERELAILEVRPGGYSVIEASPSQPARLQTSALAERRSLFNP